jgi:signal peptide peptidase SppA
VKSLSHVASRFLNCPLMIHPPKLEVMIRALGPRLGIDPDAVLAYRVPMDATATLMARYGDAGEDKDYAVVDGIAVIPVQGVLLKKESFMSAWSGTSSYEQIQRQVASAVGDAGVRAILLDIDSPGGETTGCFELSDFIYAVRDQKPIYAAANDIALSAAYAIASAASRVFVTRTGAVGSVGVYALHVDQSGFDEQVGVKYSYVFAGEKKVDGNPHEPLADGARADMQDEVDREYAIFTETVARNRGAAKKDIVATKAGLYWAENAVPLLADQVGTLDDAMNGLRQLLGQAVTTYTAARAATVKGEHMSESTLTLAGKKDGDEPKETEDKKGKGGGDETDAKAPCDTKKGGEKKKDDGEPDGDEEKDGKKASASVVSIVGGQPLEGVRAEGDILAIGALCKMAGRPEMAAEFLTKKGANGKYLSVAEVSEALTNSRVAESERSMISSHVNPNAGAGGVQELEAQATQFARQNRMTVTAGMYVAGAETRVTKERAYAAMLEEHPEAYAQFRNRHNAKPLLATLEAAGIRFAS